ncbi:MAG: permease-like cell division protein FtsX [Anaerorhabdus sp.]
MLNRFLRHIKEGFFGVGRHAAMSLSSAMAVTITLIIISIFAIFTANVASMTNNIEGKIQISVLIDYSYESQENIDRIGLAIMDLAEVETVQFYTKDEELDAYINLFEKEEERALFEGYREDNPMHHAYYVQVESGENLETLAAAIRAIEGVYETNYGGESAVLLVQALDSVRNGGFMLVIALSLLAIFLIQNTIKLTILARADEISIMRNVGAKNGFIRAPFMVEGVIIGALGAIIPILLTIFLYIYLYQTTGGVLISNMFELIAPHPFVLQVSLILLTVGMLVGLLGSFLSVTKYLRWKR